MSYGDSELAPTYYFSGIIFNPSFYSSSSSTYLTQSTAKNYFLSYPLSQGSETFSSNVKLQSTLTDTSGSVGTSGQILSSTATGVSWINGVGNSYISYNTSTLPFTLSLASNSNLYILFSGTTGSGGIMTIPTTGITNGTYIHVKNISSGTVNLSSSFIQFQTAASGTAILDLNSGESFQAYFNGTYWVQSSITKKVDNLTINNTLTVGAFGTDTLVQKSNHTTGEEINMYSTTVTGDINIAKILPSPYTLRLCNTTTGSSGASVHCCNIGIDGSNINNATNPTTGIIKIGNSLTSGTLYIGCGTTTAPVHTTGPIIIGADSTATGGINIGTDTDLTVPTVNTINIGSASYTTNIKGTQTNTGLITANGGITIPTGDLTASAGNIVGAYKNATTPSASITAAGVITGTSLALGSGALGCGTITASGLITADGGIQLPSGDSLNVLGSITGSGAISTSGNISTSGTGTITANGGLIVGSGKGITCGATSYTLTASQIGYTYTLSNASAITVVYSASAPGTTIITSSNTVPIGVYLMNVNLNVQSWNPANLTNYINFTFTLTGCSTNILPLACAGTNTLTSCTFSGILTVTSATNTIRLGGYTNISGNTAAIPYVSSVGYGQISLTRIA